LACGGHPGRVGERRIYSPESALSTHISNFVDGSLEGRRPPIFRSAAPSHERLMRIRKICEGVKFIAAFHKIQDMIHCQVEIPLG
jgi:hypothetical protein